MKKTQQFMLAQSVLVPCMLPVMLGLVLTSTAYAADGAHYEWKDLGWRIVNFVLFLYVIGRLAGKPIKNFLLKRKTDIAEEFKTLEQRKEQAQKELKDVEAQIANLEAERLAIMAEYEARGKRLEADIIAKAEKNAELLLVQAKKSVENEVAHTVSALRADLANEIVQAAEQKLQAGLSAEDHMKMINKSLAKVVLQ